MRGQREGSGGTIASVASGVVIPSTTSVTLPVSARKFKVPC